jgi:predicted transporter
VFETVNWLAVAVAALATFVIGAPWYSPLLFQKRWQREMGVADSKRGHPLRVFGLAYLFSLIATACLAAILGPETDPVSGLKVGAIVGACFVATSFGVNYQFANRSFTALLIDGGYHILQFAAFGLVLGAWPG